MAALAATAAALAAMVVGAFVWIWKLRKEARRLGEAEKGWEWERERRHAVEELVQVEKDRRRRLIATLVRWKDREAKKDASLESISAAPADGLDQWVRDNLKPSGNPGAAPEVAGDSVGGQPESA